MEIVISLASETVAATRGHFERLLACLHDPKFKLPVDCPRQKFIEQVEHVLVCETCLAHKALVLASHAFEAGEDLDSFLAGFEESMGMLSSKHNAS